MSESVVIIGGGVSGLTAARDLTQGGCPVRLFEASDRLGGQLRTERVEGCLLDLGADSFLRTKPWAYELARELGLGGELIKTACRGVYVARDGRLHRLPEGLQLGVPTRLGPFLESTLLSGLGKARAMCEPWVRPSIDADETLSSFCRRRLGAEMATYIAGPLLAGVVAGDPNQLGIASTFPQLREMELHSGGLVRGMLGKGGWRRWLMPEADAGSPFVSLRGGMMRLVERLAEDVPRDAIELGVRVTRVERRSGSGPRWRLHLEGGRDHTVDAARVVLALPPWSAGALLGDVLGAPAGSDLQSVAASSTSIVFVLTERALVEHPLDGTGFIVPEGEGDILAATWISSKWEGRAPPDQVLMRAFLGGARGPSCSRLSDDELGSLALGELRRLMGPLGKARVIRVASYAPGNPQPHVGHAARMSRVMAAVGGLEGLHLLGAGYSGVGIPDCVRQARATAKVLLEGRS